MSWIRREVAWFDKAPYGMRLLKSIRHFLFDIKVMNAVCGMPYVILYKTIVYSSVITNAVRNLSSTPFRCLVPRHDKQERLQ